MIIAKNVSKKFHEDHYALMNINFSTEERPLVVVGDEGAGKTLLLEIIAGLEKDYDGELFIDGKERKTLNNDSVNISYITSEPVLFKFKTVYKNLEHKDTAVDEVSGREESVEIIKNAIDAYVEKFCK